MIRLHCGGGNGPILQSVVENEILRGAGLTPSWTRRPCRGGTAGGCRCCERENLPTPEAEISALAWSVAGCVWHEEKMAQKSDKGVAVRGLKVWGRLAAVLARRTCGPQARCPERTLPKNRPMSKK